MWFISELIRMIDFLVIQKGLLCLPLPVKSKSLVTLVLYSVLLHPLQVLYHSLGNTDFVQIHVEFLVKIKCYTNDSDSSQNFINFRNNYKL